MKAITIWQPFASLIACGAKVFETRSWSTSHRGPIAIHAAKKQDRWCLELCLKEPFGSVLLAAGFEKIGDLPFGAIVATGTLMDCFETKRLRNELDQRLFPHELKFGDFRDGRYGWQFGHVRSIAPVTVRGARRLWDWANVS